MFPLYLQGRKETAALDCGGKRKFLRLSARTTKPSVGREQNVKLKIENVKLRRRRRRRLHNSTFYILHSQFYTLQPSYGNNCQWPIACDFARPLSALFRVSAHSRLSAGSLRLQKKPVVSSSYSQSAAFAALASYSPSSGVQSAGRTCMHRVERTHPGRDIVTS